MTIKIEDVSYDTISLYKRASTPAQRALVGYMTKSGKADDPILGGAFNLLRGIERCNANYEIYELYSLVDNDTKKKIKYVTQLALDGKLDKFAISERECKDLVKYLCEAM